MTNIKGEVATSAFDQAVRSLISQELPRMLACHYSSMQIGIIRAGAAESAIKDAFGNLLDELEESPPGLYDQGADRVFWADEHPDFLVLQCSFHKSRSGCLLIVERNAAVSPYVSEVVARVDAVAKIKRDRQEAQRNKRTESVG